MAEKAEALREEEDMDFRGFLNWEKASRDTIDFKRIYVDLAGDLLAGLLLSQIIYWHLPDENGKSRLRIERDGKKWLAKTHKAWWEEIRLTEKQARHALDLLEEKGLIERALYKFAGFPTTHIHLDRARFMELWEAELASSEIPSALQGSTLLPPRAEPPSAPQGRTITETTTETTGTETTNNNNRAAAAESLNLDSLKIEVFERIGVAKSMIPELVALEREGPYLARWQIWAEEGKHDGIRNVVGFAVAGIRKGDEPPS